MTKVVLLCDCGCGETVEKTPCKVRQHVYHFKDPSHYYKWMKEHQKHPDQSMLNRLKEYGEKRKWLHGGEFTELRGEL